METYIGDSFTILVDGQAPQCLDSINVSDVSDVIKHHAGDAGWEKPVANLQGYEISISGIGLAGFKYLRGLKRAKTQVTWSYSSTQGSLSSSGNAFIMEVNKAVTTAANDDDIGFQARLQGLSNPT